MLETIINWDINLFLKLNGIHSPVWDKIMWVITSKQTWYPLYLVFLVFIILKNKKQAWLPILSLILVMAIADAGSVHLFKNVFERLRPCHNPDLEGLVHTVNGKCGAAFGFVSSHAANHFALAVFLAFFFRKKWFTYTIIFWAALISYSRVYLGVHYPLDVICGGLYGTIIAYLMFKLYQKLNLRFFKA